jgi:RecJ-like exonuclease
MSSMDLRKSGEIKMSNDIRKWIAILNESADPKEKVTCPDCSGRGRWRDRNEQEDYCDYCGGSGKVTKQKRDEYLRDDMDESYDPLRAATAAQLVHEIEWCKKKIAELTAVAHEKPSVIKQIKDLERQIRHKELALAFEYDR